jgi:hypothetical protein
MLSIAKIDEHSEEDAPVSSSSDDEASETLDLPEVEQVRDESTNAEEMDSKASKVMMLAKPARPLSGAKSRFTHFRRSSAPATSAATFADAKRSRRNSAPLACVSRRGFDKEPEMEMPFPVRRESLQTTESRRRHTKVPNSVSPEATTMEKKRLLKLKLSFPKQRLRKALSRVTLKRTKKSRKRP